MAEASQFDAGLIPFLVNELTSGVNPVKYYEYKALDLLVFSTPFGELIRHETEEGTFPIRSRDQFASSVPKALDWSRSSSSAGHRAVPIMIASERRYI